MLQRLHLKMCLGCLMRLQETDKQAYGCLFYLCSRATMTHAIMKKDRIGYNFSYFEQVKMQVLMFGKINIDIHLKEEIKYLMYNVFKVSLRGRYLHFMKYILSIYRSSFHIILLLHLSVLMPQACKCFVDNSRHFKVGILMSLISSKNMESF